MKIKLGDIVRMKYMDSYVTGEVTIVVEERQEAKVMFDGDFDLDYWYYPMKDLEVIEEKEG